MYGILFAISFSALCTLVACAASDQHAAIVNASCSASMQPSEASRAITQSALLACRTVLQPTGALDWLIDAQQVRLRDVLDGSKVDAVELPSNRSVTLAEIVQHCWPGEAIPFRVFFSDSDHLLHSRMCHAASAAAADALHSPLLGLARVMSFDSLHSLPVALAASIVPHATVAFVVLYYAPAAMVVYPIWAFAILFFAFVDICHTPLRAAVAFRSSTNRFLTFFLRRLFVRIAIAFVVAIFDSAAAVVSACMRLISCALVVCAPGADTPLTCPQPQPPAFPFLPSARLYIVLATSGTTGAIAG